MLLLNQVLLKNQLMPNEAFNMFRKACIDYGIDDTTIAYGELKGVFADPYKFVVNKYNLEGLMSKEEFADFKKASGVVAPKPEPKPTPPPQPPPPPPPVKEAVLEEPISVKKPSTKTASKPQVKTTKS